MVPPKPLKRLTAHNKLVGFTVLKKLIESGIPCVKAKDYRLHGKQPMLDPNMLWTLRTATVGNTQDCNKRPSIVGATADDLHQWARENLTDDLCGMYYPFFHAYQSGTALIEATKMEIVATEGDLWNLDSDSERVILFEDNDLSIGAITILSKKHYLDLVGYLKRIKAELCTSIADGKQIFLQWSVGAECDLDKNPIEEGHIIFYELKTTKQQDI